jgi:hypothetical protein
VGEEGVKQRGLSSVDLAWRLETLKSDLWFRPDGSAS